jgi:hypothetical protein
MKKHLEAKPANLFVDPNCEHSRILWGPLQHVYLDDGRAIEPLGSEDIDTLCEQLNQ